MARGPQIFIIDDDRAIRTLLRRGLTAAGYRVQDAEPSRAALGNITERQIDLLILNIDSPAYDGLRAIAAARALSPVPILALSARDEEAITVAALNGGADDVIRTPFRINELLARAENALRRRAREKGKPSQLVTGDLEVDLLHRRVRSRGEDVRLAAKPYEVLRVLVESAGKVLTHEEILSAVWGEGYAGRVQYLRVAIRDLRRKIEADPAHPRYILTETSIGYRLEVHKRTAQEVADIAVRHQQNL
jgi:two-component system, OmpR family, KDP operon response regulator KdpE